MKKLISLIFSGLTAAILTVSSTAAGVGFIPSIGRYPTALVEPDTVVVDHEGKTATLPDLDERGIHIVITGYSDRENAPNDTIKQGLADAFQNIEEHGDNTLDFATSEDAEKFQQLVDDAASRDKELAVVDLFDVSAVDNQNKSFRGIRTINLSTKLDYAQEIVTIAQFVGDKWVLIPFSYNDNGTVSIQITNNIPNPISVFIERGNVPTPTVTTAASDPGSNDPTVTTTAEDSENVDPSNTTSGGDSNNQDSTQTTSKNSAGVNTTKVPSPQTGANTSTYLLVIAVLIAAVGVICVLHSKKAR